MQKLLKYFVRFVCLLCVAIIGLLAIVHFSIPTLPNFEDLTDPRENSSIQVLSKDGDEIALRGTYFAGRVKLNQVSPHLKEAIISIEDRNFYSHYGFDPFGIGRAVITNFFSGKIKQGASTLTQQLAKDLFLSSKKSYNRKIKELFYAIKIEQSYSKEQIFELYMNRVYLGAGLYGVKAAANRYFAKEPKDLTISESALLAGLLKAPSKYSPIYNLDGARRRANIVISAMRDAGYITKEQEVDALASPAILRVNNVGKGVGYVADRVARLVPYLIEDTQQDVIVYTTIDTQLQLFSDTMMKSYLAEKGKASHIKQGAFIALDNTGAVLAMTGGNSYNDTSFNRTMQAYRQPGSSFKPFVYATAFERGYTPNDVFDDADPISGSYQPKNYESKQKGAMTLMQAFAQSNNIIAVQLAQKVGISAVQEMATRTGIVSPIKPYLSLALGSFEVSPLEITNAYVPFFNGGYRAIPHMITKITDRKGKILFQDNPPAMEQILSQSTLSKMQDVFFSVVSNGTGKNAKISNVPIFGKTGTSSDYKDAWFIGHAGVDGGITAAVWLGNDDFSPTQKVTGGGGAAPLWKNIVSNYLETSTAPKVNPIFSHFLAPPPVVNPVPVVPQVITPNEEYNDNQIERLLRNFLP